MSISQSEMFEKCESLGESKVREHLNANLWNSMQKRAYAKEWLRELESSRESEVLSQQEAREREAISVARDANLIAESARDEAEAASFSAKEANLISRSTLEESRRSNLDSSNTARTAKNAAIIAAIGAIISAICAIIIILK